MFFILFINFPTFCMHFSLISTFILIWWLYLFVLYNYRLTLLSSSSTMTFVSNNEISQVGVQWSFIIRKIIFKYHSSEIISSRIESLRCPRCFNVHRNTSRCSASRSYWHLHVSLLFFRFYVSRNNNFCWISIWLILQFIIDDHDFETAKTCCIVYFIFTLGLMNELSLVFCCNCWSIVVQQI